MPARPLLPAHIGFLRAQEQIVERLVELEKASMTPSNEFLHEEVLLRKLADAIAWQLLGRQLYIARRLCTQEKPPRLTTSNYTATFACAKHLMEPEFSKVALMTDITTFIHTGDLVIRDPAMGELSFAEVKEGEKNHRCLEALKFLKKTPCPMYLKKFAVDEGRHAVDQLMRMAKQADRMGNVAQILDTGRGKDPVLGMEVRIPDLPFEHDDWDSRLGAVIECSKERGWAIDVIDDTLFLGAYRGAMQNLGPAVFQSWFSNSCSGKAFPILNLMQCMEVPLALPVFSRNLSTESIFDLLFGRCRVYVGINLDGLIKNIESLGVRARWASRKETGRLNKNGQAVLFEHRAIVCENGKDNCVIGDGLLLRMAFHGLTPRSSADLIARTFSDHREENTSTDCAL
ncbi:MAG: hypothetical protein QM691_01745 [Opitutaceae bacterium]